MNGHLNAVQIRLVQAVGKMGKHEREEKIVDRLNKENRELKAECRRLRKWLKQLNKGFKKLEDDEVIEEKHIPEEMKKICFACARGELKLVILGPRYVRACNFCDYRTKGKPVGDLKGSEKV